MKQDSNGSAPKSQSSNSTSSTKSTAGGKSSYLQQKNLCLNRKCIWSQKDWRKKNAEREVLSLFFSILEEGWIEGPTKPQRIRYYWPVEIDTTGNWK